MNIITNNIARPILYSYELPKEVLKEFDYYNTEQLEQASFFKYKGSYYDLGNFIRINTDDPGFKLWDGAQGNSWFSGVLVRCTNDNEAVIVGRYYS